MFAVVLSRIACATIAMSRDDPREAEAGPLAPSGPTKVQNEVADHDHGQHLLEVRPIRISAPPTTRPTQMANRYRERCAARASGNP